ncbi:MAG: hypothetical protein PUB86_05325 [Elusimicrobia bacterium]|nr:hypothetical protein [Elusimicrobiota bacterium]
MKRKLASIGVKIISVVLSFVILFECNAAAFTGIESADFSTLPSFEGSFNLFNDNAGSFDFNLEELYLKGNEGNIYEAALNRETAAALRKLEQGGKKAKIAALNREGKAKYGLLAPMYVKIKSYKILNALEADLGSYLAEQLSPRTVMPYKKYEELYKTEVKKQAKEYAKLSGGKTVPPFRSAEDAVINEIYSIYPVKTAYADYKKEAQAEISWRKANIGKVQEAAYKVARKYIEAIGADNLSVPTFSYLVNLKLNGKPVLTTQDRLAVYNYAVTRLEKQNLKALQLGITSSQKDKKVAANLLQDIVETMVLGGYVVGKDKGRYAKAVEKVIYEGEDGIGSANILAAGFSSLLAVKDYAALKRILNHYTVKENSSASFGDYISLTYYSGKVKTAGGRFLGRASVNTQYSTRYIYANTFTDLAKLLAEEGSQASLALLKEYGVDKGFDKSIRPFYAGALLSGKSGADAKTAQRYALDLANLTLGDIPATQEYDLDRALLAKYSGIKNGLNSGAVITKAQYQARLTRNKNLRYLDRAAFSLDVLLMVWGTIGLAKLGGKALSLSRSTYTAIRAGRIADQAKRIAYIKANYAKLGGYISARNSMLRLGSRIKAGGFRIKALFTGKPVPAAKPTPKEIKLQNWADRRQLARLNETRVKTQAKVASSSKPTPRMQAKADLAAAQYEAKKAQIDLLTKARLYGASADAKNASYLAKVKEYNAAAELYNSKLALLSKYRAEGAAASVIEALEAEVNALAETLKTKPSLPVFTAGETSLLEANTLFKSSVSSLRQAQSAYKATGWWSRNILQPWKNLGSSGDGTLGLWRLETEPGITIAEALGDTRPYNPDYTSGLRLFSGNPDYVSPASKFYTFLENHHLTPVSKTLKFINNRATILGTSLLLNYNVATVTPEALNAGRFLTTGTELVVNTGNGAKLAGALDFGKAASIPLKPVTSNLTPVSVIDPKIFQFYQGVPLPGGNLINSLSLKGFLGNVYKTGFAAGAGVAFPLMLGKDLYKILDNRIMGVAPIQARRSANLYNLGGADFYPYGVEGQNFLNQKAAQNGGFALFTPKEWSDFTAKFGGNNYVYEVPGVPNFSSSGRAYRMPSAAFSLPKSKIYFDENGNIASEDEVLAASAMLPYAEDMQGRSFTMSVATNEGGQVLPVKLTFSKDFDAKGYTNVVFLNNVAELREYGKKPRVMSNFYLRLKTEHKSLLKFANRLKALGESITLKIWQYGIEPDKTATVPLYYGDGAEELPIKVITDARFVQDGRKLVLTPSGAIGVLSPKGGMPDIITSSVVVRIPKNQRGVLLKMLASSEDVMPIEVMPSYDKATVIIKQGFYINPSLGKTLGPVLPESLGVSEAFATNLMYIVNYLPGILSPLLNPLVKKYGEVAMFKASISISMLAAILPSVFGFYGYSSTMEPTMLRTISLTLALFALAFSINIRNVIGNSLINMNRGGMPISKDKKKDDKNLTEAVKITTDVLADKFKKLFSSGSDFSMQDILYYNRSFINKNLGTMAFLIAPSVLNYAGKPFGFDFNFGWDVSLPLYAAYSAYAGYKVHKTNLRDNIIIDHIKNDVYQMEDISAEGQAAKAADDAKDKKLWDDVKEVFNIMLHKEGVMGIVAGMSLATAHELSVSSAFSSTLYQIVPDGDMATIMVIGVLYGSLMLGRLLGNITTTRMSSGTSYFVYSLLSGLGTAGIMGGIMADSPSTIIAGGVIASIGIGNYFSQMFAYIIRKHPELQSQISQALSFTMPLAVALSMPITYLNDWSGLPYARVMASLAMLVASMVCTKGMLDNSTLYKYIVQEFKEASDYVVGLYKGKGKLKDGESGGAQKPSSPEGNDQAK